MVGGKGIGEAIEEELGKQRLYSLSDRDPTLTNKPVHGKETAAFTVTEKPTHCLS